MPGNLRQTSLLPVEVIESRIGSMTALGLGCVKTKSDLVVMLSEGQIFVSFCSAHDHEPQNSGCGYTTPSFHTAWNDNGRLQWSTVLSRVLLYGDVASMPISIGAFEPEAIAAMSDAFEAACELLRETGQPEVAREVIARRIIAAARFGERDAVRLREAALRKPE
jgi:hypothetical protein